MKVSWLMTQCIGDTESMAIILLCMQVIVATGIHNFQQRHLGVREMFLVLLSVLSVKSSIC